MRGTEKRGQQGGGRGINSCGMPETRRRAGTRAAAGHDCSVSVCVTFPPRPSCWCSTAARLHDETTALRRVVDEPSAVHPGTRSARGLVGCPNSAATFGYRSAKMLSGVRIRLPLSGTEAQSRRSLAVLVPFLSGATIAEGCASGVANDIFVRKRRGVGADKSREQYHSGMLAPQRLPPQ